MSSRKRHKTGKGVIRAQKRETTNRCLRFHIICPKKKKKKKISTVGTSQDQCKNHHFASGNTNKRCCETHRCSEGPLCESTHVGVGKPKLLEEKKMKEKKKKKKKKKK
jgi:hypothetical protein